MGLVKYQYSISQVSFEGEFFRGQKGREISVAWIFDRVIQWLEVTATLSLQVETALATMTYEVLQVPLERAEPTNSESGGLSLLAYEDLK